jgi:hypothetical protein
VTEPLLEPDDERRVAVALFNETWSLLRLPERTAEEDDAMIHAAHASAHHWRQVGETKNFARSEWQCSRVYAVLGRAEPALHHARRCLAWCERGLVEDWDTPGAHEALARAHAVAGDWDAAERHERLAREGAAAVADAGDRDVLLDDLGTLPRRPA